ncbi:hypothetical protein GGI22_007689, partial [Coemansia erecta]
MASDGQGSDRSLVGINIPTPEKVTAVALGIAEATISGTIQNNSPIPIQDVSLPEPMDVSLTQDSEQHLQPNLQSEVKHDPPAETKPNGNHVPGEINSEEFNGEPQPKRMRKS